jgi:subtilisin-like proprotein convertase family protein
VLTSAPEFQVTQGRIPANYRVGTWKYFGESGNGSWKLYITDLLAGTTGTFNAGTIEVRYHVPAATPVAAPGAGATPTGTVPTAGTPTITAPTAGSAAPKSASTPVRTPTSSASSDALPLYVMAFAIVFASFL